ncbi:MAG: hypothetical protein KC496_15855, partial [Anaerolineae bacterium]|nr:hypothetical protein [Anaerolineae bacterium]
VFGVILGALSLYTDELTVVRFADQPMLRFLSSALYGQLFSSVGLGLLQAIYFGPQLDYLSIFGIGFSIAVIFIVRSMLRLYGFRAFVMGTMMLFVVINLFSATPERTWNDPRIPIFWFRNTTQQIGLSLFMAICMSLSITGWEMAGPYILRFVQRIRVEWKDVPPPS